MTGLGLSVLQQPRSSTSSLFAYLYNTSPFNSFCDKDDWILLSGLTRPRLFSRFIGSISSSFLGRLHFGPVTRTMRNRRQSLRTKSTHSSRSKQGLLTILNDTLSVHDDHWKLIALFFPAFFSTPSLDDGNGLLDATRAPT